MRSFRKRAVFTRTQRPDTGKDVHFGKQPTLVQRIQPALEGCHSQGATLAEALENAKEAIALYLEVLAEEGKSPPEDHIIPVPLEVEVELPVKATL